MSKWKMYVFVKTKDKNGKRFSKGKLVGQGMHVAMRLGSYMARHSEQSWNHLMDYYHSDGEIKLVFKRDENAENFIDKLNASNTPQLYYKDCKDITSGEYIAFAILTNREVDTGSLKLL